MNHSSGLVIQKVGSFREDGYPWGGICSTADWSDPVATPDDEPEVEPPRAPAASPAVAPAAAPERRSRGCRGGRLFSLVAMSNPIVCSVLDYDTSGFTSLEVSKTEK